MCAAEAEGGRTLPVCVGNAAERERSGQTKKQIQREHRRKTKTGVHAGSCGGAQTCISCAAVGGTQAEVDQREAVARGCCVEGGQERRGRGRRISAQRVTSTLNTGDKLTFILAVRV